jgi:hypothetical protein
MKTPHEMKMEILRTDFGLLTIAAVALVFGFLNPDVKRLPAFVLGAALGSFITYYILTRERRIVADVLRNVSFLAGYHELTEAQQDRVYRLGRGLEEIASREQILSAYSWAQLVRKENKGYGGKSNTGRLAAEVIICQQLLGLSPADAMQAWLRAKSLEDFRTLRPKPAQGKVGPPPQSEP